MLILVLFDLLLTILLSDLVTCGDGILTVDILSHLCLLSGLALSIFLLKTTLFLFLDDLLPNGLTLGSFGQGGPFGFIALIGDGGESCLLVGQFFF